MKIPWKITKISDVRSEDKPNVQKGLQKILVCCGDFDTFDTFGCADPIFRNFYLEKLIIDIAHNSILTTPLFQEFNPVVFERFFANYMFSVYILSWKQQKAIKNYNLTSDPYFCKFARNLARKTNSSKEHTHFILKL